MKKLLLAVLLAVSCSSVHAAYDGFSGDTDAVNTASERAFGNEPRGVCGIEVIDSDGGINWNKWEEQPVAKIKIHTHLGWFGAIQLSHYDTSDNMNGLQTHEVFLKFTNSEFDKIWSVQQLMTAQFIKTGDAMDVSFKANTNRDSLKAGEAFATVMLTLKCPLGN